MPKKNSITERPSLHTVDMFNTPSDTPVVNLDERIRSILIDGDVYHSLIDILTYHGSNGSADNPSKYWNRAKERIIKQGGEVIPGLVQHRFDGQGQRDTPVVNLDGFMRVIQAIDIPEWESIRAWMAKQAAKKIKDGREERLLSEAKIAQGMHPTEAKEFARQVVAAKETRNDWTAALQAAVIGSINYGQATNTEYVNLFGRTAKEIKEMTGFTVARDAMTTEGRAIVTAVEATMTKMFLRHENLTFNQALRIVEEVCSAYRISVVNVEKLLGVELATGRALLPR